MLKESRSAVMLQNRFLEPNLEQKLVSEHLYKSLATVLPPSEKKEPPSGWQIHDFKYKNRKSLKNLKLEPLENHK